ncbi:MAG: carbohydrate kinase family protein [Chlamydiae bacterium]|nr:MAG: carbohydrate kinase family protein [Chlamydiota bacterium]
MKNNPEIIVAGHLCLDIIPGLQNLNIQQPEDFFVPGKLVDSSPAVVSTGGCVSNTGLGLVKMGINAALMGKVGEDSFGRIIKMIFRDDWGVTDGLIVDKESVTSHTTVISPKGYDRMFLHCPGANDTFSISDIDFELVAKAKHFHFGYPPLMRKMYLNNGEELVNIFRRAKETGLTTSLDMALPDPDSESGKIDWKKYLQNVLPYVDIYLPSAEEILFMLDKGKFFEFQNTSSEDSISLFSGDDLHNISSSLLDMGAKIIMIKCGHRGSYIRTADKETLSIIKTGCFNVDEWANIELWQPAFKINVRPNATGSGDATIAGFLTAYIKGCSAEKSICYANATGACSVTAPGALAGLISWEELTERLESGWESAFLEVEGDKWEKAVNTWKRK